MASSKSYVASPPSAIYSPVTPIHPHLSASLVLIKMEFTAAWFIVFTCMVSSLCVQSARFDDLFQPSWASDHLVAEGDSLKLKLDSYSGAGFASKNKYLFGKATIQIKLVEGDSAGTVTAFYMASDGPSHNEFDFEFLGNTTGQPYLVQTNVYVNGVGNREQRLSLWFDPTKDFHSYSLLWNHQQVVFLVDDTPVRVFSNKEKQGIPFPKGQPMGVYSSIWNADDWATQGGRVKTNWSHAPFVSTYRGFEIEGCVCSGTPSDLTRCQTGAQLDQDRFWWEKPVLAELSVHQSHQLMWVRAKMLVYDYCTDSVRFPTKPLECERR